MTQTYEASNKFAYAQSDRLGIEDPAIFNSENTYDTPTTEASQEEIRVSNQALLAHETLRNLVQIRNMYDTDTFPNSGYEAATKPENPTDDEIRLAAEEVAALTLDKTKTNTLNLQSAIPDNTNFYEPPTVEVASLLVNAAIETQDESVKALAEATLPKIDNDMAQPLTYGLHESFGDTTDEEHSLHESAQLRAANQEKFKLIHAAERVERVSKYTDEELDELEQDDAVPYNPLDDED